MGEGEETAAEFVSFSAECKRTNKSNKCAGVLIGFWMPCLVYMIDMIDHDCTSVKLCRSIFLLRTYIVLHCMNMNRVL